MGLKWRGRQVSAQVRAASVRAVEETTRAAAASASGKRSGRAADVTAEQAQPTTTGASGRWGVFPEPHGDPHWELFVEVGTAYLPGDQAKRRAADEEYPKLAGRIRRHRGR
ncbi:MAG: hypothetical protein ACODAF_06385 [Actinomycetota bacterium]